ncbi:MAG: hypothetical protein CMI54_05945 [Parcubacteria group bacterium]|nr:hypothetical protein [Parcubacteria group bacterium]|tara:strand:+ start:20810 stop:21154 length:345 start_codon:yes stop_codon:yes gene_type:complete
MPIYEFQHPTTGEVIEVVQGMKEKHVHIDENDVEWVRIWSNPNASIDSFNVDPFSEKAFLKVTAKKGMTAGEMMDLSGELSKKRESSRGLDPVKNKTVTDYEKKTGKAHPNKSK